ncbi:zinc-binding alcohol dehydrogenase [Rhodotorula toruloides]|uniref:Zinc-binding alcohol dehydrogenase n=1 Tax=Rhodotorula toruloides TaxID=5286 RepID=A0A511KR95_RHOTO|nr:zinc-binding alcohol dehydrogenase [Rhodotorula toruloides]
MSLESTATASSLSTASPYASSSSSVSTPFSSPATTPSLSSYAEEYAPFAPTSSHLSSFNPYPPSPSLIESAMAPLPSTLPSTYSRITLRERPKAAIDPKLDGTGTFQLERGVKMFSQDDVKPGEAVIKVEWVSIDPAMRGWLNPTRSYVPPVAIGATMRALAVGRVVIVPKMERTVEGGNDKSAPLMEPLKVGDWVTGVAGWAEYAKLPAKDLQKIQIDKDISPTYYLGALGMTGQTAYWGIHDVGKIKPGETVVVSGAAGAVGSIACQLAKIQGCKVVAIAGGKDKCRWLKEDLGIDTVLDYKDAEFKKKFREIGYLDVYFDNVGGDILDMCLTRLNKGARIALCGAISAYNDPNPKGLQAYLNLISQRAKIEGASPPPFTCSFLQGLRFLPQFIVFDYADRYHIAAEEMARYIRDGRLKLRETHGKGLEDCVEALVGLFAGKNQGKMLVKIAEDGAKL